MTKGGKVLAGLALVSLGVVGRLLPHAWNFTPLIAITLVAGHYLGRKHAIWVAITAMLIGDYWLGFYETKLMLTVYLSLAAIGLGTIFLQGKIRAMRTMAVSAGCSFFFFLATNWAVWQFSAWYPKTLSGLLECYAAGLPFFRNALLGDVFYTAFLFLAVETGFVLVSSLQARWQQKEDFAVKS